MSTVSLNVSTLRPASSDRVIPPPMEQSNLFDRVKGNSLIRAFRSYHFLQIYKGKDQVASVFFQVFGAISKLPISIRETISDYIPQEMESLGAPKALLPSFVNLTDPSILVQHLSPSFQSQKKIDIACELVKSMYEAGRVTKSGKYGIVYPIQPELMSFLMKYIKELGRPRVLEIGCADGKLGFLFAYAGAQVTLNDIDPLEKEQYDAVRSKIAPVIQSQVDYLLGDSLKVFGPKKHKWNNMIDILYCGNLIHFFNDKKQNAFFNILDRVLKKGGIAVASVNSLYCHRNFKNLAIQYPNQTSFQSTQAFIHPEPQGTLTFFMRHLEPCLESAVSFDYSKLYLYEKKLGSKWQVDQNAFSQLAPQMRQRIKKAIDNSVQTQMKALTAGTVDVLMSSLRMYTLDTLRNLFTQYKYEVLSVHAMNGQGHIVEKGKEWEEGVQITILAKKV